MIVRRRQRPTNPGRQSPATAWQGLRYLTVAAIAAVMTACANGPERPAGPSLQPTRVSEVRMPGQTAELLDATQATFKADPQRLPDDVKRAIRKSHWGRIRQTAEGVSEDGEAADAASAAGPVVVRARALLPDDREASIFAWQSGEREVTAAIRVGHFGDPDVQRQWLSKLAEVMAGPPAPQRYRYRLPHLP